MASSSTGTQNNKTRHELNMNAVLQICSASIHDMSYRMGAIIRLSRICRNVGVTPRQVMKYILKLVAET